MSESGPLLMPYGCVSQSRADLEFGTDFSFALGSSSLVRMDDIDVGDVAELQQIVDLTPIAILTCKLRLRGVSDGDWLFQILAGFPAGVALHQETITVATDETFAQRAFNVSTLNGNVMIRFRLEAL